MRAKLTIPTEVLSDIFHLLCDAPIALHDLTNESRFHEFPWAVGQVCRHWRGAFLSYAHLWTSFALKSGNFSGAYYAEMNRRAAIYLERSGQQPLTILVSGLLCLRTEKFPKTVWRMLLSCLKRWKKADLELGHGAALDELLKCRGYMSSLESLRMSIPDSTALKNSNAFEVAPHLTELHLAYLGFAATWQFPWAQLTKLKLEVFHTEFDNYSNNIWGVLFQLQTVEWLTITTAPYYDPSLPSSLPIIHLPCLRFLEIPLATILSWFTAPLLEHLHVYGCNAFGAYNYFHNDQPYERELTSLIQRSSCHIRRLTLENCRTEEMRIIIKTLDSVEELSVNYPSSPAIIQDVTGLDGCIYLPKLQVLQVTCIVPANHVKIAVGSFSRLLEARGKGLSLASHDIVPLEKFVVWLTVRGKCPDKALNMVRGWPSFAQVYINGSVFKRSNPSA